MVCANKTSTINTVNTTTAESGFRAKVVKKEQKERWFEHNFNIDLEYCDSSKIDTGRLKRTTNAFNNQSYKCFDFLSRDIVVNGSKVSATIRMRSRGADAAEAEKTADAVMQKWMKSDKNLTDVSFKLSTTEKERVTTFDAWAGIDTYA